MNSNANIDSTYRIFRALNLREIKVSAESKAQTGKQKKWGRRFYFSVFLCIFTILAMGMWKKYLDGPEDWTYFIALSMLVLLNVTAIIYPLFLLWLDRGSMVKFVKNPFQLTLDHAKRLSHIDRRYVRLLSTKNVDQLSYILIELKAEKDAFHKRVSLMVGSIDRLGLLPSLLSTAVLLGRISPDHSDWIFAIGYATVLLYFVGVYAHYMMSRMERMIGLLGYVIEMKTEGNQHSPADKQCLTK